MAVIMGQRLFVPASKVHCYLQGSRKLQLIEDAASGVRVTLHIATASATRTVLGGDDLGFYSFATSTTIAKHRSPPWLGGSRGEDHTRGTNNEVWPS